jgi:hypothetical protein
MKTSLYCLIIAVLLRLSFDVTAQTVEVYNAFGKQNEEHPAKQIFICGGTQGLWLTISRFDTTAPDQHGFSPNYTYAICKFLPIVKRLPNGLYQISFTSEFTKNLP